VPDLARQGEDVDALARVVEMACEYARSSAPTS